MTEFDLGVDGLGVQSGWDDGLFLIYYRYGPYYPDFRLCRLERAEICLGAGRFHQFAHPAQAYQVAIDRQTYLLETEDQTGAWFTTVLAWLAEVCDQPWSMRIAPCNFLTSTFYFSFASQPQAMLFLLAWK